MNGVAETALAGRRDAAAYRQTVFVDAYPFDDDATAFVVLTACDPPGQCRTIEENTLKNGMLHDRLLDLAALPVPTTGASRDASHREPGWAAAVDVPIALALARAFEQAALFAVRDGELYLVWSDNGDEERLGPARAFWRGRWAERSGR